MAMFFGSQIVPAFQQREQQWQQRRRDNLELFNQFRQMNPHATLAELSAMAEQVSGGNNWLRRGLPAQDLLQGIARQNELARVAAEQEARARELEAMQNQSAAFNSVIQQLLPSADSPDDLRTGVLSFFGPLANNPAIRQAIDSYDYSTALQRYKMDDNLKRLTSAASLATSFEGQDPALVKATLAPQVGDDLAAEAANIVAARNREKERERRIQREELEMKLAPEWGRIRVQQEQIDLQRQELQQQAQKEFLARKQTAMLALQESPDGRMAIENRDFTAFDQAARRHSAMYGVPYDPAETRRLYEDSAALDRAYAQESLTARKEEAETKLGTLTKGYSEDNKAWFGNMLENSDSDEDIAAAQAGLLLAGDVVASPAEVESAIRATQQANPAAAKNGAALADAVRNARLLPTASSMRASMPELPVDIAAEASSVHDTLTNLASESRELVSDLESGRFTGTRAEVQKLLSDYAGDLAREQARLQAVVQSDPRLTYNAADPNAIKRAQAALAQTTEALARVKRLLNNPDFMVKPQPHWTPGAMPGQAPTPNRPQGPRPAPPSAVRLHQRLSPPLAQ